MYLLHYAKYYEGIDVLCQFIAAVTNSLSGLLIKLPIKIKIMEQHILKIKTSGRGTYLISDRIQEIVTSSAIETGLCHLFLQHTSASLILCENADATVRHDLENFMQRIAPDGDPVYQHDMEGDDDMPAHIRTILTQNSLTIPVTDARCNLGTWQGIYLWEHRTAGHNRTLIVTLQE